MNTYRFICALLISWLTLCAPAANEKKPREKSPFFGGAAVSVDLVGLGMKAFGSSYSNMEVAGRINLLEQYFPTVELGIGTAHREGGDNNNVFKTTAPFMRVGLDYNFMKKIDGNRLFAGARYGFSSYTVDFTNPDMMDPVWHTPAPVDVSHRMTSHWLELVVGMETKLWRFVRIGYTIRYKFMIDLGDTTHGEPSYIPGFGLKSMPFGGTFNLAFDIGKSMKKRK